MNIIMYFGTLLTLAVFDIIWLFSMGGYYKKMLGHLFAPTVNFLPAIIFYLIYAAGIVFFVISPGVRNNQSLMYVLGVGMFFGLIAYATYDLTNNATMKDWPVIITIIDIAWGAILTGFVSVIVVAVINYFK